VVTSAADDRLAQIAQLAIRACGVSALLAVGDTAAELAAQLARLGADARHYAGAGPLPFTAGAFPSVILETSDEWPADRMRAALAEVHRVSSRAVFVWMPCLPVEGETRRNARLRHRWEEFLLEAGYRKHPTYYRINPFDSLAHDRTFICMPFEKALDPAPSSPADMLRMAGEHSDTHVARYDWACRYVKPGDRVLDLGCGGGYGAHMIGVLTEAESVVAIDGNAAAIAHAASEYRDPDARLQFRAGDLMETTASFGDGTFEVVVCLHALASGAEAATFLRRIEHLLSPGGRAVLGISSGDAVFEPDAEWLPEDGFAQSVAVPDSSAHGWERADPSLRTIGFTSPAAPAEWRLLTLMKSPLGQGLGTAPYEERVFRTLAGTGHPSLDYAGSYRNPWLMHAMVSMTHRLRNGAQRERLAREVMRRSPADSNDYAAALTVLAYRVLERALPGGEELVETLRKIEQVVESPPRGAMGLRWKVSLLFVQARLLQAAGQLGDARATFEDCGRQDVRSFGIHLSTKITEALFLAGKIAAAEGDRAGARICWERGVDYGRTLLACPLDEILIEPAAPNRFNHGDGVREYTVAWDNIARCANGLHLLARGGYLDDAALENCFQTEYTIVLRELVEAREHLAERTKDLVETRATLVERTSSLEGAAEDLRTRTEDLVRTRETLVQRTRMLEDTLQGLPTDMRAVANLRLALAEQVHRFSQANGELAQTREQLFERSGQFEVARSEIMKMSAELLETRNMLAARTREAESLTRQLHECSGELEARSHDLEGRTTDLVRTRETLAERTRRLETATGELADRTVRLEAATRELAQMARALETVKAALQEIAGAPLRHAMRKLFRRGNRE
jgi:SAM-dependent methyltransferase